MDKVTINAEGAILEFEEDTGGRDSKLVRHMRSRGHAEALARAILDAITAYETSNGIVDEVSTTVKTGKRAR